MTPPYAIGEKIELELDKVARITRIHVDGELVYFVWWNLADIGGRCEATADALRFLQEMQQTPWWERRQEYLEQAQTAKERWDDHWAEELKHAAAWLSAMGKP